MTHQQSYSGPSWGTACVLDCGGCDAALGGMPNRLPPPNDRFYYQNRSIASPSPGGEGRGEGELKLNSILFPRLPAFARYCQPLPAIRGLALWQTNVRLIKPIKALSNLFKHFFKNPFLCAARSPLFSILTATSRKPMEASGGEGGLFSPSIPKSAISSSVAFLSAIALAAAAAKEDRIPQYFASLCQVLPATPPHPTHPPNLIASLCPIPILNRMEFILPPSTAQ